MDPSQKNPDHNLVNQARPSRFSSKILLTYVFRTLPVVSAALFSFSYRWFLEDRVPLFPVFLTLGFYLITTGVLTLITRRPETRRKILFMEVLAFMIPLLGWPALSLIIIFILLLIFFYWGIVDAEHELLGGTEIKFSRIIRPQFSKMITGLTFLVLLVYMPHWNEKDVMVSENVFQRFFRSTSEVVGNFYPEVNFYPTSTIGSLTEELVMSRLKRSTVFQALPESAQKTAIQTAVNDFFINTIQKSFGSEIRKEDPATRVFYEAIVLRLNSWRDRFGISFAVIWGIIMFFLIRGLGIVVSFVSLGILFIIFHMLLATRVLKIGSEMRQVETLELT